MDVIIWQIISKYDTKCVIFWGGGWQDKETILKEKISGKKTRRERTDFPEKQVVQSCPCSH